MPKAKSPSPLIPDQPTALQTVSKSKDILRAELEVHFKPFREAGLHLKEELNAIRVTDASQTMLMQKNGIIRKQLQRNRINIDNTHKRLKADAWETGKLLDFIKNELRDMFDPLEDEATKNEKFIEFQEKERKAKLRAERLEILSQHMPMSEAELLQIEEMTDVIFNSVVAGAKQQKEDKAKEQERQRNLAAENAKLQQKVKDLQVEKRDLKHQIDEDPFKVKKKAGATVITLPTDGEYHISGQHETKKPVFIKVRDGKITEYGR